MLSIQCLIISAIAIVLPAAPALAQPAPRDKAAAQIECDKAHKLLNAKEYDKAIVAFTAAITLDPTADGVYFSRSSVYGSRPDIKNRKLDLAIADLDRVLQLKPGNYSALFNRAGYYREVKKYDDSIRDYTEIISGATDFSNHVNGKDQCLALTHCYRGDVYLRHKQDHDRAIKDYTEALRLNPKVNDYNFVFASRGSAHLAKKEYAKARDDFEAETKAHPDHAWPLEQLARLLATCPDPKCRDGGKAVEVAEKAQKLTAGSDPAVLDTLAAAYAETGAFDKAIEWQEKAIKLSGAKPGNAAAPMEARLALYRAKKPFRDE
ncbi:MAG TPA: tetratricopeptide repeat protein [Gemmata sp.]